MSTLSPAVTIHLAAALGALVTGPVALWARRAGAQRPKLHRAFGYAWVTLMAVTAVSALWIRGGQLPNINGYSPVHLLVPLTLFGLVGAFIYLARGNIRAHRRVMLSLYFGACVTAGVFTLLPDRFLGQLVWGEWLGLITPGASHEAHAVAQQQAQGMVMQILGRTPLWVWGLLAGLLVLGLLQTRRREVPIPRLVILPLALGVFSFGGLLSDFGAQPVLVAAFAGAAALMVLTLASRPAPAGVQFDARERLFLLPGSWVPLALILGIFLTKYAVGVSLAMQPALKAEPAFALAIATLSGVFTGLFAGRALRLLRLAFRPRSTHAIA
jgi:uncharacterized membrane protein